MPKNAKRRPEPKKSKLAIQEWVVSRTQANPATTMKVSEYHIQVSTRDTLAGFVVVPGMIPLRGELVIQRGKSTSGDDYFTLNLANAVTFNLVGRIEYRGDWEGVPG